MADCDGANEERAAADGAPAVGKPPLVDATPSIRPAPAAAAIDEVPAWAVVRRDGPIPDVAPPRVARPKTNGSSATPAPDAAAEAEPRARGREPSGDANER